MQGREKDIRAGRSVEGTLPRSIDLGKQSLGARLQKLECIISERVRGRVRHRLLGWVIPWFA